ncbi:hypothetical protein ACFPMF_21415 [Larkinella bovis]|uniref:DUF1425 domain-containing protein n=1 Tax=Larkinella bovis TaxID=683041 RepID=A0ABW0II96_9BACT
MKILYCLLFLSVLACQSKNQEDRPADAYRDLLVDRVVWKKTEATASDEKPTNVHRFTITNTSDAFAYEQIEVRFDYFDSTYHKIRSTRQILDKTIGPRAALMIGEVKDGPALPTATSSTVTIVRATAHKSEPEK